jgi:imidazole glycerol-phosphate synthase subunit HisH
MSVLIVDYGMGNLASVARALEDCGAEVVVSDQPSSINGSERIVVPGVGSFADASRNLGERGWTEPLWKAAKEERLPLMGICLGMQLLATSGDEGGQSIGLGLIPGRVQRLIPSDSAERIPHVGWNEVHRVRPSFLWEGVPDDSDFYFVHSYHFVPDSPEVILGRTPYCGGFVAAVEHSNVVGFQFHPEKSSRVGRSILSNFLRM